MRNFLHLDNFFSCDQTQRPNIRFASEYLTVNGTFDQHTWIASRL